ncbi:MAG: hypothetical protein AAF519_13740, partial [Bacteroidota bacterium]
ASGDVSQRKERWKITQIRWTFIFFFGKLLTSGTDSINSWTNRSDSARSRRFSLFFAVTRSSI